MMEPTLGASLTECDPPGSSGTPGTILQGVWDETAGELARVARAMGLEPGQCDDVLQDVYLTALEKPPAEIDSTGFKRWLFRVTINRCRLMHRKRARRHSFLQGLTRLQRSQTLVANSAADAADNEEREIVRRALARLQGEVHLLLVLRYYCDLDSREIGRIVEMPHSTVRSKLRAGRRLLANELRKAGYEGR